MSKAWNVRNRDRQADLAGDTEDRSGYPIDLKPLFDTNVFRDIQRGTISEADVTTAEKRLASGGGCFSPLSLIELGSHICDEEKQYFDRYHLALRAARRLCSEALPDPETILRERVFGATPDGRGLKAEETLDLVRIIAQAGSYDELVGGQVTTWQGVLSQVSYNAGHLKKFREDYEAE